MARRLKLLREVTIVECPWLKEDYPKGKTVYEYNGATYGCISNAGVAVSMRPNKTPFFEIPKDALPNQLT
jgi:hypothetical protein